MKYIIQKLVCGFPYWVGENRMEGLINNALHFDSKDEAKKMMEHCTSYYEIQTELGKTQFISFPKKKN